MFNKFQAKKDSLIGTKDAFRLYLTALDCSGPNSKEIRAVAKEILENMAKMEWGHDVYVEFDDFNGVVTLEHFDGRKAVL